MALMAALTPLPYVLLTNDPTGKEPNLTVPDTMIRRRYPHLNPV